MSQLPTINAFWIGPRLGRLHAACLRSFVEQGHRVILHTYNPPPEDRPKGVEIADAAALLGRDRIIRHQKSGSLALAADLFRYELMAADAGIYVDCDCYCVAPLAGDDFLVGWETDSRLCNAVLQLSPDCPLLAAMRAIGASPGFIPPWEKPLRKKLYRFRLAAGAPVPLSEMKWGTTGPIALTYYAKALGLADKAKPIDVFYPLHYHHVGLLRDPEIKLGDLITPRTKVVHLWNEYLNKDNTAPLPGSPLAEILSAGDG